MAEQVGLFAKLKFMADSAIANMGKTERAFSGVNKQAERMKKGMAGVQQGLTDVAIVGTAAAGAGGLAVKKFADFGGQMGAVKAVLGKEAAPEFANLEALAKRMGATTAFTAVQAGEAMENLARAGQKPRQIMASLGPVLDAAAAEGMDLGTAADIVASNLAAFGLNASEAARVADTLAFVSAKTNTNMVQLQEGMKFAAPVARDLGISIEDTAGTLGALADIGLKGSLSGTALKNSLLKISQAAKKGFVTVGKYKVQVEKTDDGSVKLLDTFQNIVTAIGGIDDKTEQAAVAMKLLGLRGLGAKTAFQALTKEKIETLFGKVEVGADGVARRVGGISVASKGAAREMAAMRLNNLKGQFTILKSAVEGVSIEMGAAISQSFNMGGGITTLTEKLGQAAKAFQFFSKEGNLSEVGANIEGVDRSVSDFVQGLLLGLRDVGDMVRDVAGWFTSWQTESNTGMTRLITQMVGLSAVIAPVGLAVKGVTKLFGGFAKAAVGAARLAAGALGGIAKVGGGILQKIPGLARVLPGVAGKLAKTAGAVEKITAQPVRVVNFDEMGAGGALGGAAAGGTVPGAPAAAGGARGARASLASFVARFGKVGAVLNSSWGMLGKAGMGLAGKLGIFGGAVAAAGTAGYALGSWLNEKFGISDKLADGLWNLFNQAEIAANKAKLAQFKEDIAAKNAEKLANRFADLSAMGVKQLQIEGGGVKGLTRATAEERISKFLAKQGKTDTEISAMLKALDGTLKNLPTEVGKTVNVNVNVDGKTVARADAKHGGEQAERMGKNRAPGARRREALGAR
jgi:TP901 family phage tail tape measure protein